jgi:hypothetical protein
MNKQDIKDIEKICDKVIDEIKGDGMEIISKELLSDVLGYQVIDYMGGAYNTIPNSIYMNKKDGDWTKNINIHELAHKCKEWATGQVTSFSSGYNEGGLWFAKFTYDGDFEIFFADTEPEAIFKATSYILEQNK